MSKNEIIDHIRQINPSAGNEFLDGFSDEDLLAYLHQLQDLQRDQNSRQKREPALVSQS